MPSRLDDICVKLRKWTACGHSDLVLYSYTIVDGNEGHESYRRLSGMADAEAIRLAIQTFDELVAAHPTLGTAND